MTTLLINDHGTLSLVELPQMEADAEVIGEVVDDGNGDPLIALKNPFLTIRDMGLFDSLFTDPPVRLSKIKEIWGRGEL